MFRDVEGFSDLRNLGRVSAHLKSSSRNSNHRFVFGESRFGSKNTLRGDENAYRQGKANRQKRRLHAS
jgi:hypothetical protein